MSLEVIFPKQILDAAELLSRDGIKESNCYPISWSVTGIAAPSVNVIIAELLIRSNCKVSGIYYDFSILNAAAVLRKPTDSKIEINTNPLSTISKIGDDQFTGLAGAILVPNFVRFNLPNQKAFLNTDFHPMLIAAGSILRIAVTVSDPAIIAADTVTVQLNLIFNKLL